MDLLERLRNEVGLPMLGRYPARPFTREGEDGELEQAWSQLHVGWTTDQAKADAAREAGATVSAYRASDPAYNGWEVSVTEIRERDGF